MDPFILEKQYFGSCVMKNVLRIFKQSVFFLLWVYVCQCHVYGRTEHSEGYTIAVVKMFVTNFTVEYSLCQ